MNLSKVLLFFSVLIFGLSVAQTKKNIEHKIIAGETLSSISKKYNVPVNAIIALNPAAKNGIQLDKILLIPVQRADANEIKVDKSKIKSHEVKAKETKYSISKLYNISIQELEKLNPVIVSDGVKIGQVLQVTASKNTLIVKSSDVKNQFTAPIYHIITNQETKYSVSKKYGISIEQLEKQNPEIASGFSIGTKLIINTNKSDSIKPEVIVAAKTIKKVKTVDNPLANYVVKKGETIYSLSRLFSWSEEKLLAVNPELQNGVVEGMIVKSPENIKNAVPQIHNNYKDLSTSIVRNIKKELVLFLPFNVSKIENDTINSIGEKLKKDKFLNLTLDFYSGALMAIDSAKVLNMNLNVRIYDSEETKNSSAAVQIVNNSNFQNTDVIIGPFYQLNVEKVAEFFAEKPTYVISPLSKEVGKSYKNLLQSMPTSEATKNAMFDYMRAKNGNIIAIVDPKKLSIKQYLDQNQNDLKLVNVNEKGVFVADSIKKHFLKNQINYVVMESERTGVIFTTTTTLLNAMKDYQVQLVLLEQNETLDFEEIALTRLTKLKMMFPSTTLENESDEAKQFVRSYKKKNKIYPNQYAIRGFDLVFDTMLRLSQSSSFEETLNQNATQQIENKFDYTAKPAGGFANNGISILYYDTDLFIKQAQ